MVSFVSRHCFLKAGGPVAVLRRMAPSGDPFFAFGAGEIGVSGMSEKQRLEEPVQILVVDKNQSDIDFVVAAFAGYWTRPTINVVTGVGEALAFLRNENEYQTVAAPDVVVFGFSMALGCAQQVINEMHTDNYLRSVPAIILTTNDNHKAMLHSRIEPEQVVMQRPDRSLNISRVVEPSIKYWIMTAGSPRLRH
jgi:CheY-like chemotaxis protein